MEAHALRQRGWSISAIARHLDRDRKRSAITSPASGSPAKELGYALSYPSFVRQVQVAGLRPHCEACSGVVGRDTIDIAHPAGEDVQWDWFERRRLPWGGVCYVLLGTLRSRRAPASMRNNRTAPLVDLPEDVDLSTVTAGADRLPSYQPCLFGTTAWTIAEGKRQLAETANSFFHGSAGALTDIERGYTRMFDSGRIKLFVTFSLVGYNRQRIHQWLREQRLLDPSHPDALAPIEKKRAPRRNRAKRFCDLGAPVGAGLPADTAA